MNAALRVALIVALIAVLSLSGSAVAQTGLGGIGQFSNACDRMIATEIDTTGQQE